MNSNLLIPVIALLVAAFLFGCTGGGGEATPTPMPTATPTQTATPTPTATPSPSVTPTPITTQTPNEFNCTNSGGTWLGPGRPVQCDCGESLVYNQTSTLCEQCPEGEVIRRAPFSGTFCLKPSGFEGMPCDRQTDCRTGYCFLVDASAATGKGICSDLPFGCNVFIDENGSFDPEMVLCVD